MENLVIHLCNSLDSGLFHGFMFACKVIINGNKWHVLPCTFRSHNKESSVATTYVSAGLASPSMPPNAVSRHCRDRKAGRLN